MMKNALERSPQIALVAEAILGPDMARECVFPSQGGNTFGHFSGLLQPLHFAFGTVCAIEGFATFCCALMGILFCDMTSTDVFLFHLAAPCCDATVPRLT